MTLRTLVDSKMLSRRTAQDRLIDLLELHGLSPSEEGQQILVESILYGEDDVRKALAKQAAKEFSAELAEILESIQNPPQEMPPGSPLSGGMPGMPGNSAPPALSGPPGAPAGMGQGPMMGMPPGVVPPQSIPEAVAARSPVRAARMMSPPPGPGRPPGEGV